MRKTIKWILIILGGGLLLFFGCVFYVFSTFRFDDGKHYSTQDLIDNYNQKSNQITDLKTYVNKIIPTSKSVDIEFEGNKKLFIFHLKDTNNYDSNWDLNLNSAKTDTLLKKLNWTKETLKVLKEKLDAANCISVKSGEPCNIGFQRSGMGKFYYNIFDNPIPDSLKNKYNDSCTYILYTDKVVLEYGGGAIGPQCFPIN
ncbi:hypothetical protein A8C56_20780 [Niabella ginsenosidivorans]|uniref:Lipoprotein n=1 Tax=Niabella ginsenosidivorans TaxID=1176587 RepID=A0A1A9I8T2_9BACT|nr:hypothetical protein [Niabella ginsenosidivorans]ANH83091.1 hypothetical protein A8C56_20780 [Niabella ginsenosidivorans]